MDAESARKEWSTYTEELENALISKISDELPPPTESLNVDRYEDDDDGKEGTCQNTNASPEVMSATMENTVEIAEAELEQEGKQRRTEEESGDVEKISTAEEYKNEIDEFAEEVVSRFEDLCEESIAELGKRMELHVQQNLISADEPEQIEDDDDGDVVTTATKPDVDEIGDNCPNELKQGDHDEAVEIIEENKLTISDSCATVDHSNPSPSPSSTKSGLRRAFDFLKIRKTNKIGSSCQSSASKGSDSKQSALCILQ